MYLAERIGSTASDVRNILIHVDDALDSAGVPEWDRSKVETVLAEVLNNIVEHAYSRAGNGWIDLLMELQDDILRCEIADGGSPMPGLVMPRGNPQELDVDLDDLPEGGFGWFLIRELTEQLQYARRDGSNHLVFRIHTDAAA